jgi:hypothetical protein
MARPQVELTPEQVLQVETLASVLSQEQIADYLGIAKSTFQAILDRDPVVFGHYKKGKSKAIASVAQGLLKKALNGDTASAIFYLKTQAGWAETKRHEVDGNLSLVDKIGNLDTQQLEALGRGILPAGETYIIDSEEDDD